MDFDRAQQILEALQTRCPHTDPLEIDVWTGAITRAREALVLQQIMESETRTTSPASASAGTRSVLRLVPRNPDQLPSVEAPPPADARALSLTP